MAAGTTIRRHYLTVALPALAGAFAAGCGASSSSPATSSPAQPTGSSRSAASARPSGTAVTASETEYKITLSRTSFTAGTYTFVVKDTGAVSHALEIKGQGIDAGTEILQPGQSRNLTVTLKPGTYDVFCPVDGHKGLGMNLTIHVT